jgi:hypothetical protein
MPTRVPLVQISSRSWEHPADRAALNTLRAIPGFDEIVRKIAGFFGERGIRQLFLGDAVKVTATQRPNLNVMWTEVLETLDWPERPELYNHANADRQRDGCGIRQTVRHRALGTSRSAD